MQSQHVCDDPCYHFTDESALSSCSPLFPMLPNCIENKEHEQLYQGLALGHHKSVINHLHSFIWRARTHVTLCVCGCTWRHAQLLGHVHRCLHGYMCLPVHSCMYAHVVVPVTHFLFK